MTGTDFAQAVADRLGVPPLEDADVAALLQIASVAAHASERLAAPLCTYLAGRSGRPLAEVRAAVDGVAADDADGA